MFVLQIDLLGPGLIRKELTETRDIIVRPVAMLPNIIELMYYNNGLVTIYAMQSVVATALNFLNVNAGFVLQEDLMLECVNICQILQNEFIFSKPCQNLESVILECVDDLILRKQIFIIVSFLHRCFKLSPLRYSCGVILLFII